ncbi:hypothetical protein [Saccharothrix sp. ALI-22-I]|uniref:hypothetical protein n=1 Tax=Saccharothrix sp. ALI-22-I TaxID=1933778 RepID=UPI00117AFB42|nr:hypothetical protein [Saccharothrix sp. ALI-22-I]
MDVEPDEIDITHRLTLKLVDECGNSVQDPRGGQIEADVDVTVRGKEGIAVPGTATIAVTLAPGLTLEPGVYVWEVRPATRPDAVWKRSFAVLDMPLTPMSDETATTN